MKVLFLYLRAFSGIGGIENFNKAFMKASEELSIKNNNDFKACSLHDHSQDDRYISSSNFKGFWGSRITFILQSIVLGLRSDIVIIGHVNLAIIGRVIKMYKKDIKVIHVAHGIEVWSKLPITQKWGIKCADNILAVSNFTKQKLVDVQSIDPKKITIFPNTIDPFFEIPSSFEKPKYLMDKYGIKENSKVVLSISRLTYLETSKGLFNVLAVLPEVIKEIPDLKYIIVGGGEEQEVRRLRRLIITLKLENNVILTGFVPDEEIKDYYLLSDVFVLPSKQEGFGIVFIESLVCGRPVIAGNADGSVDALLGGELGTLTDPDDMEKIANAIIKVLKGDICNKLLDKSYLQSMCIKKFGFDKFRSRMENLLENL